MNQAARRRSGLHRAFVATVFVLGLAALVDALYTLQAAAVPVLVGRPRRAQPAMHFVRRSPPSRSPASTAHVSFSETSLVPDRDRCSAARPPWSRVALDGLTFSLRQELLRKRERQYRHAAFDLAEPALSMWAASTAY